MNNHKVSIKPVANVGEITVTAVGPATVTPGIFNNPSNSKSCNFVIKQKIRVQIPVDNNLQDSQTK